MALLYADENFPQPAIDKLRQLGHDVVTLYELGNANQRLSDEDVLRDAATMTRVLLTLNRKHFIQLHQRGIGHSGIIVCTVDPNFDALATRIHEVLMQDDLAGQLIRSNRPNI